jgi:hypothetical protein
MYRSYCYLLLLCTKSYRTCVYLRACTLLQVADVSTTLYVPYAAAVKPMSYVLYVKSCLYTGCYASPVFEYTQSV